MIRTSTRSSASAFYPPRPAGQRIQICGCGTDYIGSRTLPYLQDFSGNKKFYRFPYSTAPYAEFLSQFEFIGKLVSPQGQGYSGYNGKADPVPALPEVCFLSWKIRPCSYSLCIIYAFPDWKNAGSASVSGSAAAVRRNRRPVSGSLPEPGYRL